MSISISTFLNRGHSVPDKQNRMKEVDLVKGVTILWVVMMHLEINPGWIDAAAQMGIFFLVSGILYRPLEPVAFLRKRIKSLLIPLLFFWILSWLFQVLANGKIVSPDGSFNLEIFDFIDRYSYLRVNILWFLAALFATNLIYNTIFNKIRDEKSIWIIVASLVVYVIGSYLYAKKIEIPLFPLSETMIFQVYFLAGVWFFERWSRTPPYFVLLFVLYALFFNSLPVPFLVKIVPYTLLLFGAMISMFRLMKGIPIWGLIQFFGVNSIIVYLTHMLMIHNILGEYVIANFGGWCMFLIICVLEIPLIYLFNKFLPSFIGKSKTLK